MGPPPPALLRGNDVLEGALSLCLHIRAKVNPKVNPKVTRFQGNPAGVFEGNTDAAGRRARQGAFRAFVRRARDRRERVDGEREGARALASVARERRARGLDRLN